MRVTYFIALIFIEATLIVLQYKISESQRPKIEVFEEGDDYGK